MSGSRSERQSSRRKLNRKRFLGALLGLTLTLGMFPSSLAVADTPDPSGAASAGEQGAESSPTQQVSQEPAGVTSSSPGREESASSSGSVTSEDAQSNVASSADEVGTEQSDDSSQPIVAFGAGPESSIEAPYLYWEAKSAGTLLVSRFVSS